MLYIILGVGIACLILEIFVPTLFFLNFAIAAFVCAGISQFYTNKIGLIGIFCLLSLVLIFAVRPLMTKNNEEENETGINAKYIGKTAKVIEPIDKNKGVISIYDERWQARNVEDSIIETDETVEIVGNDSIIMQVKKIN